MVKPNYEPPPSLSQIGPEHNRMRLRLSEFERADLVEGFRYELIDGVLQVSPAPGPDSAFLESKLSALLFAYRAAVGEEASFAYISGHGRLLIRSDEEYTTNPEPDISAYRGVGRRAGKSWQGIYPALVVEVVSPHYADKDYVRNVALYESVADIVEYWIIDPTKHIPPSMTVFRRATGVEPFQRIDVPQNGKYESTHWPGLVVDLALLVV